MTIKFPLSALDTPHIIGAYPEFFNGPIPVEMSKLSQLVQNMIGLSQPTTCEEFDQMTSALRDGRYALKGDPWFKRLAVFRTFVRTLHTRVSPEFFAPAMERISTVVDAIFSKNNLEKALYINQQFRIRLMQPDCDYSGKSLKDIEADNEHLKAQLEEKIRLDEAASTSASRCCADGGAGLPKPPEVEYKGIHHPPRGAGLLRPKPPKAPFVPLPNQQPKPMERDLGKGAAAAAAAAEVPVAGLLEDFTDTELPPKSKLEEAIAKLLAGETLKPAAGGAGLVPHPLLPFSATPLGARTNVGAATALATELAGDPKIPKPAAAGAGAHDTSLPLAAHSKLEEAASGAGLAAATGGGAAVAAATGGGAAVAATRGRAAAAAAAATRSGVMVNPYTPLMQAAIKGNSEAVADLIAKGASFDEVGPYGYTPLMFAAQADSPPVIACLLAAGASLRQTSVIGDTALMLAAEFGKFESISLLYKAGEEADRKERREPHTYLNQMSPYGYTALTYAIERHSAKGEIAKWLLECGATCNVKALMAAFAHEDETLIGLLLKDFDVNQRDPVGLTPLIRAARRGCTRTVSKLLKKGASADFYGLDGSTPLMHAAEQNHEPIVKVLLANGAPFNQADLTGSTALMRAAKKNHTAIVTLLLEAGADVNQVDLTGSTAFMGAAERGCSTTLRVLDKAKADRTKKNKAGQTAFDLAKIMGCYHRAFGSTKERFSL